MSSSHWICKNCKTLLCEINFPKDRDRERGFCHDCKALMDHSCDVSHHSLFRCPECRGRWGLCPIGNKRFFVSGQHEMTCPICNCGFSIHTEIQTTIRFHSPMLKAGN